MFSLFESLFLGITSIIEILGTILSSVLMIISFIPSMFNLLIIFFDYMPPPLFPFLVLFVSFTVLYFILGK